jgi:hypothetical protein
VGTVAGLGPSTVRSSFSVLVGTVTAPLPAAGRGSGVGSVRVGSVGVGAETRRTDLVGFSEPCRAETIFFTAEARRGKSTFAPLSPQTSACRKSRHEGNRSSGVLDSARATTSRSSAGSGVKFGWPETCSIISSYRF